MTEPLSMPTDATAAQHDEANAHLEHASVRFEPTDINVRGVIIVVLVALCLLLLLQSLVYMLFRADQRLEAERQASVPLAFQPGDRLPARPRLEQLDRLAGDDTSNPAWRALHDETQLNTYGPTDEAGFVHVPIDWAIGQAAQRLPVRKAAADSQDAAPTNDPGRTPASAEPKAGGAAPSDQGDQP